MPQPNFVPVMPRMSRSDPDQRHVGRCIDGSLRIVDLQGQHFQMSFGLSYTPWTLDGIGRLLKGKRTEVIAKS